MNTVNPNTASTNSGSSADTKQILLKDIGAKWNKFSEQELGALKSGRRCFSQRSHSIGSSLASKIKRSNPLTVANQFECRI